jgi:thiol-disulfide isomerase/thioredoxin
VKPAIMPSAAIIATALLGSWMLLQAAPTGAEQASPVTPIDAPQFEALLAGHRGEVIMVNYWATWCAPCLREIPDLMAVQEALAVVATSHDAGESFAAPVRVNAERWRLEGCPMKPIAIAIAIDGQQVYTAWYSGAETPPGVHVAISADGGRSFAAPVALHPAAALSDSPSVAASEGVAYAAWHACVGDARRIYLSASHNQGASWSALVEVPGPANGGGAGHPLLATEPGGSLLVAWLQDGRAWVSRAGPVQGTELAQRRVSRSSQSR